mgnify:FL=1|jgi:polyphosphate kinase
MGDKITEPNLSDPSLYINRELSWLEFNKRCLEEAEDRSVPLLERVKFLAICHSNMDEFFMIRIYGLLMQSNSVAAILGPDQTDPSTVLNKVLRVVGDLTKNYESCWKRIRKELYAEGIRIKDMKELTPEQRKWASGFYKERVHPLLTPLALDVSHPFPFISNNSLNLAVEMERNGELNYARVKIPVGIIERFVEVPSDGPGMDFIFLEDLVKDSVNLLFPGFKVMSTHTFRVTRNADVKVTIDEACDLIEAVEESLDDRDTGFPVRMTVDGTTPKALVSLFGKNLSLSPSQIHTARNAIALSDLWQIANLNVPRLHEEPFVPYTPAELTEDYNIFDSIKERDWLLFHPYESFATVVRLVKEAAEDPKVQSIKICLYRIGNDSSIINALKRARENGKTVSVLMELRAKFDENRNIKWAKDLEKIGVHVVFGPIDLKVHCKILQIVRLEGGSLIRYTHMSSGNYNVSTAKQYCDTSLLTANREIGEDVGELFNALTGYYGPRDYKHLLVAPMSLKNRLIEKIDREMEHKKKGGSGYIAMKANGLVDQDIISSLYRASMAGVKIDLNIRGLCCLRPGIKGISENIRLISIVDRFLEHSRIYYFDNGGDPEMYLGSSDLMPRNLIARVEALFPILDKGMLIEIRDKLLKNHLADNVKARELMPDGSYVRVKVKGKRFRSQRWFIENRGSWHGKG